MYPIVGAMAFAAIIPPTRSAKSNTFDMAVRVLSPKSFNPGDLSIPFAITLSRRISMTMISAPIKKDPTKPSMPKLMSRRAGTCTAFVPAGE